MAHAPQTSKKPFEFADALGDRTVHTYQIATLDEAGRRARTGDMVRAGIA